MLWIKDKTRPDNCQQAPPTLTATTVKGCVRVRERTLTEANSEDSPRLFRMDFGARLSISSNSFLRRAVSSSLNSLSDWSPPSALLPRLELLLLLTLRPRLNALP